MGNQWETNKDYEISWQEISGHGREGNPWDLAEAVYQKTLSNRARCKQGLLVFYLRLRLEMLVKKCGMKIVNSAKPKPEKQMKILKTHERTSRWKIFWMTRTMETIWMRSRRAIATLPLFQYIMHRFEIWMPRLTQVKPTNTARSHGKKFKVTVEKKTTRILGNFGWAYMQLRDYTAAKDVYWKAQVIEPEGMLANIKCMIQVGFRGEASVGDAYNQIWFVKPEEKMKLLKKTRKIKDCKETLYVAGSNISRSQHSKETSLEYLSNSVDKCSHRMPEVSRRTSSSIITRRSASHELPLLKALQSVAKKHKRGIVMLLSGLPQMTSDIISVYQFLDEENGGGNEKLRRYFNKVVGCLDGKMIWPYQGFLQHCFSFRAKTRKLQKVVSVLQVRLWLEMLIKKCGMKKAVKSVKPKETYETPEKHERWKIFWMRTTMGLYGCGVVWP
ncbi:unnamed protein product [Arabidopsis arenosa]|uniref:Uncharacterized protein n=1 Tax=Arabidopsis arenosa TaxID=38785 RepID=A0A8S2AJD3_ARAAE|nr:unnamed protein product [Arabidopsis arenosa]